jgi:hypothetical protein
MDCSSCFLVSFLGQKGLGRRHNHAMATRFMLTVQCWRISSGLVGELDFRSETGRPRLGPTG